MDQRSKIAILGFGVEGKAMMKYLLQHGYSELTVCDQNVDLPDDLPDGVSAQLGPHYLDGLKEFDAVFRSPGIPFLHPLIQDALNAGVEVNSAIKFFMDQCPCPIVGVTGTKGKGTTSTLIFEMLKAGGRKGGKDVFLGGNIGKCPITFLDDLNGDCLVVLELSSFQLQDLHVAPKYSVMLNTTSDHLDYHEDRDEYMRAKEQLLSKQGKKSVAVLNRDYEYCEYYRELVQGDLFEVSVEGKVKRGAYVVDGEIFYDGGYGEAPVKVANVSEIKMVGAHNIENVLPATVIAMHLGVPVEAVADTIRTFENLPYRLQFVRELNGVSFYNDSFSTGPQTSMSAVDSFDVPTVLIAGGYDKGLDYGEWAVKILTAPTLIAVVLIGDLAPKMEAELIEAEEKLGDAEGSPTKILRRNSMEEAVLDAYAECDGESVVVLSPAAASFDMYENYKERGNDFVAQVRKLK